jgi:hypothetical protein
VVRSIGAVLRARGVAKQEVDDGVAEVQTRVMELLRLGPAPANLAEWRMLANKVAAELAIDLLRKRNARRKHEEDLCEDPDAFANESVPMWHPSSTTDSAACAAGSDGSSWSMEWESSTRGAVDKRKTGRPPFRTTSPSPNYTRVVADARFLRPVSDPTLSSEP